MWKIKVLIQFLLSKLPKGEAINYLLQRMNHSHNEDNTKKRIIGLSKSLCEINKHVPLEGANVVEVGTGWEPICSVLLYLMGVENCHTYDHVPHVRHDLAEMLIASIESKLDEISGITSISPDILRERISRLKKSADLDDFFSRANIVYHAPADASRTGLENSSIDLVFSYAVLEHVPEKVINEITIESKRVLKGSGIAYHMIGLHDHYVSFDKKISKVNFLKYSEFWWSFFVKNRISFHNRLREKQFIHLIEQCGAKVVWKENKTDPNDVRILQDMKVDSHFDGMSDEELAIYATELILSFSSK